MPPPPKKNRRHGADAFVIPRVWTGQVSKGGLSFKMAPDPQRLTSARTDSQAPMSHMQTGRLLLQRLDGGRGTSVWFKPESEERPRLHTRL